MVVLVCRVAVLRGWSFVGSEILVFVASISFFSVSSVVASEALSDLGLRLVCPRGERNTASLSWVWMLVVCGPGRHGCCPG